MALRVARKKPAVCMRLLNYHIIDGMRLPAARTTTCCDSNATTPIAPPTSRSRAIWTSPPTPSALRSVRAMAEEARGQALCIIVSRAPARARASRADRETPPVSEAPALAGPGGGGGGFAAAARALAHPAPVALTARLPPSLSVSCERQAARPRLSHSPPAPAPARRPPSFLASAPGRAAHDDGGAGRGGRARRWCRA